MNRTLIRSRLAHLPADRHFAIAAMVKHFITTSATATGRATHENSKAEIVDATLTVHQEMMKIDRGLYAALLRLNGALDNARQVGVRLLLDNPGNGDPSMLYMDEETATIHALIDALPTQRKLNLFLDLKQRRVNNARTRKSILYSICDLKDPDWVAVKYRRKLRESLTFAWGQSLAGIIKSILAIPRQEWLTKQAEIVHNNLDRFCVWQNAEVIAECISFALGNPGPWRLDKLAAYAAAPTHYESLAQLPPEVAEGFRARYHQTRSKADVLDKTKQNLTVKQKVRVQKQAAEMQVKVEIKPEDRAELVDLFVLAYERGLTASLSGTINQRASAVVKKLAFSYKNIALVLDGSESMSGSKQQKWRPIALQSSLHAVLLRACDRVALFQAGGCLREDYLLGPQGDTTPAASLIDALEAPDTEAVFVVSDGYENAPAGRFHEVLAAARGMGVTTPVFQINPVMAAETFGTRQLSELAPVIPLTQNIASLSAQLSANMLQVDLFRGLESLFLGIKLLKEGEK